LDSCLFDISSGSNSVLLARLESPSSEPPQAAGLPPRERRQVADRDIPKHLSTIDMRALDVLRMKKGPLASQFVPILRISRHESLTSSASNAPFFSPANSSSSAGSNTLVPSIRRRR
jgi:hypothetical protein